MQEQSSPIMISLNESACMGECPVFELNVHENRMISFTGVKNTLQKSGTDTLSEPEFTKLLTILNSPYFLEREYIEDQDKILDAPVITIQFSLGDTLLEIAHQGIEPEEFTALRIHLEKSALRRGWLKKESSRTSNNEREVIVELESESDLDDLIEAYEDHSMHLIKKISPSQLFFLLRIRASSEEDLEATLTALRKDSKVKMAQWNHQLQKRKN